MRGRRLAVDVGKARVGLAISDPDCILSSPLATIQRSDKASFQRDFLKHISELEPIEIFVGLPRNLRNEDTSSTTDAIEVARWIAETTTAPIFLVDERFSTNLARTSLREAGRNEKSSRAIIDQQAACVILETGLQLVRIGKAAGIKLDEYTAE